MSSGRNLVGWGVRSGENGVMIRGWPAVGARIERVWFTWGKDPDPGHRYPCDSAPIVQAVATEETRDRRRVWDKTNDPFIRVEWFDCTFGPEEPEWLPEELGRERSHPREAWDVSGP